MHLGEIHRAMNIARNYGQRLILHGKNIKEHDRSLSRLILSYPSHGFIIDRSEAKNLFLNVREPDQSEQEFAGALEETSLLLPLSEFKPIIEIFPHETR